jgi:hypothetical protein
LIQLLKLSKTLTYHIWCPHVVQKESHKTSPRLSNLLVTIFFKKHLKTTFLVYFSMLSPYDLLGPHIHSKKLVRKNSRQIWPQWKWSLTNEARNTKNTHLSKPYLQTWKNNEICGNQKLQNTLLPMPLVVTWSLHISMLDNFTLNLLQ